ncbi:hypothetical protein C7S15_3608 [Burkholderia cepacia]|nr:hypothetical protein [Burkholderia cepacia]
MRRFGVHGGALPVVARAPAHAFGTGADRPAGGVLLAFIVDWSGRTMLAS